MNYLRPPRTPIETPPPARANARSNRWRDRAAVLLAAALPQPCELCGGFAGRHAVCPSCTGVLPRLPERHCPVCADRSEVGAICARCLAQPPAYATVVAAYAYAAPIDDLVQGLKYGHRLHLAEWFGQALASSWFESPASATAGTAPVVIPMPLHADRLVERGFNQATEIARPLARHLGVPLAHEACIRSRATTPQARLQFAERPDNVRNAFECRIDLSGRCAILVDDVMTSGASIGELARTVRLHGAVEVFVAVAARTLHD